MSGLGEGHAPRGDGLLALAAIDLHMLKNKRDGDVSETGLPSIVSLAVVREKSNSFEKPLNPWFIGTVVHREVTLEGGHLIHYEFNNARRGWHYGWYSTKTTKDFGHVFTIGVSLFSSPYKHNRESPLTVIITLPFLQPDV